MMHGSTEPATQQGSKSSSHDHAPVSCLHFTHPALERELQASGNLFGHLAVSGSRTVATIEWALNK